MKSLLLLAALMGGLCYAAGCQTSDGRRVGVTDRPSDYDRAYVATRDTEWRSSKADDAQTGTIPRGTTVYFDHIPTSAMNWMQARVPDGAVRYVHPADFTSAK